MSQARNSDTLKSGENVVDTIPIAVALLLAGGVFLLLNERRRIKSELPSNESHEKWVLARTRYHRLRIEPRLPVPNLLGEGVIWSVEAVCTSPNCRYRESIDAHTRVKSMRWLAAGMLSNPRPWVGPWGWPCSGEWERGQFIPPDLSKVQSRHKDHPILSIPLG